MRNPSSARLKSVDLNGKNQLIVRYAGYAAKGVWSIHLDSRDGPLLMTMAMPKTKDWSVMKIDFPAQQGVHDLYLSYKNPALKNPDASGIQFDWFYFTKSLPGSGKPGYDSTLKNYWELLAKNVPTTPIMMDNPADMTRSTYVFERGNWLVKGDDVKADVPQSLNPLPKGAPRNRLGLAMWLTDKKNPLTARAMVNRIWEQLFGNGIVETLEDLGTQGLEPTHRELLDYLSYQFMNEYKWDMKKLLKEIVLSATYRQDSKVSGELTERDPYNKLYARGARVRLSAEQVRDQALAISGLLSKKMYGPGVMPWQPDGIWMSPYDGGSWKMSQGEDQNRRALYTYWKRTAPYPSMITFDGVGREVCAARRIRTNTPLQALVTLNDSVYLEASRHLAIEVEKNSVTSNAREKISWAYEKAMYKKITSAKLSALEKLYNDALKKFIKDESKTCEIVGLNNEYNKPETAALVVVMNALLNLDEVITKS